MKYALFISGACIWISLGRASYKDLIRPSHSEPSPKPALNNDLKDQVAYVSSMVPVGGYENCRDIQESFYSIAKEIGAILIINDIPGRGYYSEAHNRYIWGQTNYDTIWLYKNPCYGIGFTTFFHEVGHLLLHEGSEKDFESKEYEANSFSDEIINHINHIKRPKTKHHGSRF